MSLTLKREDGDSGDNRRTGGVSTGVTRLVRAAGRWIVDAVHGMLSPGQTSSVNEPVSDGRRETELRVVDEDRADAVVPVRATVEKNREANRPPTPGEQSAVQTQRRGEHLRVYDPDHRKAYVSSDTWKPVKR